ncbi:hypothetical protein [Sorangium sp. So ce388]|uniref:hypothetical protein n=1 Tax=Sorangium sp. So ce388 TaxID=3133309 RepID=UPI003F5B6BDB
MMAQVEVDLAYLAPGSLEAVRVTAPLRGCPRARILEASVDGHGGIDVPLEGEQRHSPFAADPAACAEPVREIIGLFCRLPSSLVAGDVSDADQGLNLDIDAGLALRLRRMPAIVAPR